MYGKVFLKFMLQYSKPIIGKMQGLAQLKLSLLLLSQALYSLCTMQLVGLLQRKQETLSYV